MAVAGIIFVLVVISCSGIQAGPGHAHTHSSKIKEWHVTPAVKSGMNDPSWVITEQARKDPKVELVARYLDAYSHHKVAVGRKLPSILGYKGFTISHLANGKNIYVQLPKCLIPDLELLLVRDTIPNNANVSESIKNLIICQAENCKRKKKKLEQVNCYAQPTTTTSNPKM